MSRRSRLKLDGIPIHIRKPGNNRKENRGQTTFYAKINVVCPYYSRMLEP